MVGTCIDETTKRLNKWHKVQGHVLLQTIYLIGIVPVLILVQFSFLTIRQWNHVPDATVSDRDINVDMSRASDLKLNKSSILQSEIWTGFSGCWLWATGFVQDSPATCPHLVDNWSHKRHCDRLSCWIMLHDDTRSYLVGGWQPLWKLLVSSDDSSQYME